MADANGSSDLAASESVYVLTSPAQPADEEDVLLFGGEEAAPQIVGSSPDLELFTSLSPQLELECLKVLAGLYNFVNFSGKHRKGRRAAETIRERLVCALQISPEEGKKDINFYEEKVRAILEDGNRKLQKMERRDEKLRKKANSDAVKSKFLDLEAGEDDEELD